MVSLQLIQQEKYIISCIGESTTHGLGTNTYPQILMEKLNESEEDSLFKVYNHGYIGASSDLLVSELPQLIELVKPNMIILMMGINDEFYYSYINKTNMPNYLHSFLLKFHSYKLFKFLNYKKNIFYQNSENLIDTISKKRELDIGTALEKIFVQLLNSKEKSDEKLITAFEKIISEANKIIINQTLYEEVSKNLNNKISYESYLNSYYKKNRTINLPVGFNQDNYAGAHAQLVGLYLRNNRINDAIDLMENVVQLNPYYYFFHVSLSELYKQNKNFILAKYYDGIAKTILKNLMLKRTRENFLKFKEITDAHKIQLVVMQYPRRNISILKVLFKEHKDIIFVENRGNIEEAINESSYDFVFNDRFAGDFGHLSTEGNKLIVKNLLRLFTEFCST